MKKTLKILFSRVPIIVALILIQVIWFVTLFVRLSEYYAWISSFFSLLSILMVLSLIQSNKNPSYKIVWILVIGIIPLLGGLLYLIFGNTFSSKKLNSDITISKNNMYEHMMVDEQIIKKIPTRIQSTSRYIYETEHYPVYENTEVKYYKLGEHMFVDMLEALNKAEKFIFFEYFIVAQGKMWNDIKDILIAKAKQGVDVRVMFDDFGCMGVLPRGIKKELESHNIKVLVFNPLVPFISVVLNNRDHRKILVIDGYIGFNGGINISDEYINLTSPLGHWKDTGVRLMGDGVWSYTSQFLEIWCGHYPLETNYDQYKPNTQMKFKTDGFIQPYSDSPLDEETIGENVYMDILWQAKDYVYICTPYLIIDHEMYVALSMAAKRGVDVRIVVPGIPDKKTVYELTKSYFKQLIKEGVKIYTYTPGFIHAKSYVSDDIISVVGTINMDYRSLYLHFECATLMINSSVIKDIKEDCLEMFEVSEQVTLESLGNSKIKDLYTSVLRIFSPMM